MHRTPLHVLLGLVLLCSACAPGGSNPGPEGPNVLLLVMDTTRGDRCSVNGYPRPTTPCLEEIAAEGALYRNAWSPAGWTGPAHASLFTGLRPETHGFLRGNRLSLAEDYVTLAERLREAGYRTACLTNNNTITPDFGLTQGFEVFAPLFSDTTRPYPWADATHHAALAWATGIRREGGRFFLFVNDMEPHYPYTPPEGDAARFTSAGASPEAAARTRSLPYEALFGHNSGLAPLPPEILAAIGDLYDAEIASLDAAIGRLVDGLRRAGVLDDTLVVIAGDHGENLGDHGLVDHMFSLHRSIRHVPLVVRYPARFPPGTIVDDVVRLEDVAPTVLEVCGLAVPPGLDGRSLLSSTSGRVARAAMGHPDIFIDRMIREFPEMFDDAPLRADLRAVLDGRHHTIRYSDGRVERYDVVADPEERVDLEPRDGADSGEPRKR